MAKVKNKGQAIAKARDEFFHKNPHLLKGGAGGQFLKNRLEIAFIAGWDASNRTQKKRKK